MGFSNYTKKYGKLLSRILEGNIADNKDTAKNQKRGKKGTKEGGQFINEGKGTTAIKAKSRNNVVSQTVKNVVGTTNANPRDFYKELKGQLKTSFYYDNYVQGRLEKAKKLQRLGDEEFDNLVKALYKIGKELESGGSDVKESLSHLKVLYGVKEEEQPQEKQNGVGEQTKDKGKGLSDVKDYIDAIDYYKTLGFEFVAPWSKSEKVELMSADQKIITTVMSSFYNFFDKYREFCETTDNNKIRLLTDKREKDGWVGYLVFSDRLVFDRDPLTKKYQQEASEWAEASRQGFHPKNTTIAGVGAHECGHMVSMKWGYWYRKINGEEPYLDTLDIDGHKGLKKTILSKLIDPAIDEYIQKYPNRISGLMREMWASKRDSGGLDKIRNFLIKGICTYATKNYLESVAEASCDVYENGDNANPLSLLIEKRLRKETDSLIPKIREYKKQNGGSV